MWAISVAREVLGENECGKVQRNQLSNDGRVGRCGRMTSGGVWPAVASHRHRCRLTLTLTLAAYEEEGGDRRTVHFHGRGGDDLDIVMAEASLGDTNDWNGRITHGTAPGTLDNLTHHIP